MKRKYLLLLMGLSLLQIKIKAQGIPNQWNFINNHTKLLLGKKTLKNLYNDSLIHKIELDFYDPNYWSQLQGGFPPGPGGNTSTVLAKLTYNGSQVIDSVGVRFKGTTSHIATSFQDKKSFNIELDYTIAGSDIKGYKTLNLQNCYDDPSFIREVMFMHLASNHIPAAKANYTTLYINGQLWGLYPNIQQLNKKFFSEWFTSNDGISLRGISPDTAFTQGPPPPGPLFGNGKGAMNYLGPNATSYQQHYTLKYADVPSAWDSLNTICDVLNNSTIASLPIALEPVMDVDRVLWVLATEIVFADDDGYAYKGTMDYFVFWEEETGRWTIQEYDANTTMYYSHVTWSPFYNANDSNYPLLHKLLQVPQYRQRYLAHMRTIISQYLDQTTFDNRIDYYSAMIDTAVQNDPKKLYTYSRFQQSRDSLKIFASARRTYLLSNNEVAQQAPTISSASHYVNNIAWSRPSHNQSVDVRATVSSSNGISAVYLYYSNAINGMFTKVMMFDDGLHNDGIANDGTYGASIPGFTGGSWVRYYVEAVSNNAAKSVSYLPVGAEHDVFTYLVIPRQATIRDVVINEIMASNKSAVSDNNGDYDDWIELHNKSNFAVDISGWTLTDNQFNLKKYTFPNNTVMQSGSYMIIWADEDGGQGWDHCNFKLNADGESVYLLNGSDEFVDEVSWASTLPSDSAYARDPNATGNFVVKHQTFAVNNNWALGLQSVTKNVNFSIYPNPANKFIELRFDDARVNHSDLNIEIIDVSGRVIRQYPYEQQMRMDISGLAEGLYIVRAGNSGKKFVVQH